GELLDGVGERAVGVVEPAAGVEDVALELFGAAELGAVVEGGEHLGRPVGGLAHLLAGGDLLLGLVEALRRVLDVGEGEAGAGGGGDAVHGSSYLPTTPVRVMRVWSISSMAVMSRAEAA